MNDIKTAILVLLFVGSAIVLIFNLVSEDTALLVKGLVFGLVFGQMLCRR